MNLTISDILAVSSLGAVVQILTMIWFKARLEESIRFEYARQLEILRGQLLEERQKRERSWLVKRDACLKALNIANAVLSNYQYPNVAADQIVPQTVEVVDVRACFNELACSCNSPDVLAQLKRIMFGSVSPDAIVDLRNAVRRELEFGTQEIDSDRETAFVGRVVGQTATSTKPSPPSHTPVCQ